MAAIYLCLRLCKGFAGMTPLHEAILLGSLESVNKWIPCSDKDERNFLGQTPIHLAISNSRHLRALINAGHDLNSVDNYGITPLMYAAATNQEECLRVLLEAGANPFIRDTRYQRTFMQYAALSGHWNLILIVLYHMKAVAEKKTAESWAKHATLLYYVFYPDYHQDREVSSQQLLATCGSVNFTFDHYDKELENSTLLHYVRSANDIEALLEQGFRLVNHVNSTGQHALMRAVLNQRNPDMVRRLLDAGAEINLKDNSHYTTLYYVLNKLQRDCEEFAAMDIVRILLANGADVLCRDSCRCPCSPNGCLPSALLQHAVCENFFSASLPVWSLEWLSLVLEYRGKSEAEEILLLFIRKGKFDEMEMTHVCCTRNHISIFFRRPSMSDEDIDEILDEESEFVQILEDEMALSSAKVYETLLDDWMLQIKASLEKSCEQAIEFNKRFPCDKEPHQVILGILPLL
jgi:ankyrin repeat protein